jgi:hypothetical protein
MSEQGARTARRAQTGPRGRPIPHRGSASRPARRGAKPSNAGPATRSLNGPTGAIVVQSPNRGARPPRFAPFQQFLPNGALLSSVNRSRRRVAGSSDSPPRAELQRFSTLFHTPSKIVTSGEVPSTRTSCALGNVAGGPPLEQARNPRRSWARPCRSSRIEKPLVRRLPAQYPSEASNERPFAPL